MPTTGSRFYFNNTSINLADYNSRSGYVSTLSYQQRREEAERAARQREEAERSREIWQQAQEYVRVDSLNQADVYWSDLYSAPIHGVTKENIERANNIILPALRLELSKQLRERTAGSVAQAVDDGWNPEERILIPNHLHYVTNIITDIEYPQLVVWIENKARDLANRFIMNLEHNSEEYYVKDVTCEVLSEEGDTSSPFDEGCKVKLSLEVWRKEYDNVVQKLKAKPKQDPKDWKLCSILNYNKDREDLEKLVASLMTTPTSVWSNSMAETLYERWVGSGE